MAMGNSEDKNSPILACLEQDMKFKLSPLSFLSLKITLVYLSCVFLHAFNFSWNSLTGTAGILGTLSNCIEVSSNYRNIEEQRER